MRALNQVGARLRRLGGPAEWAVVAALLMAAGLATAWLRHGMSITWRLNGTEIVTRTTEYRVEIKTSMRPLSRYVQAWDFRRHGVPPVPPDLDAVVEVELTVPPGRPMELFVDSANKAELLVDGKPVTAPLASGRHDVQVHWTGTLSHKVSFRLLWGTAQSRLPVPRSALRPSNGCPLAPQVVTWVIALSLGAAFIAYRRFRVPPRQPGWLAVGVAAVLLVGAGLRAFDYQVAPDLRENDDELFATWNGWQLLHDGKTRGWSLWPDRRLGQSTKIQHLDYFGKRGWEVVQPYFEHPPLLHLMVGAAAHAGGADDWTHARLVHTRIVPVALSVLSLLLVMLLALELAPGTRAWLFAGGLYAFLPLAVLQGRVIKEEALVAPLVLAAIYGLLRWRRSRAPRTLWLASIAAALCPLAKLPGASCTAAFLLLLIGERDRRALLIAGGAALGAAALLVLYAAIEGWSQFWFTSYMQGTRRPTHFNIFLRFFDHTQVNHNAIGRGWILALWALFLLGLRHLQLQGRHLTVPLVLWLLAMGVSSGNWTFGWYDVPVYPVLCIGAGAAIAALWDEPGSVLLLPGFVLAGLLALYCLSFTVMPAWAMERANWPTMRSIVTVAVAVGVLPFLTAELLTGDWRRRAARVGVGVVMATFACVSSWIVVHYDVVYELYKNFDRGPDFFQ